MSSKSKQKPNWIKITKQHVANLQIHGPLALRRRSRKYFFNETFNTLQFFATGLIPILGVAFFGGSSEDWLIFFLLNCWMAIACDAVRIAFLREEFKRFLKSRTADEEVWQTVNAIRSNKKGFEAHLVPTAYPALPGLLIDILFGFVSSLAILLTIHQSDLLANFVDNRFFVIATAAKLLMQVLFVAWEIVDIKMTESRRLRDVSAKDVVTPVKILSGLRGFTLFVLMFVVMIVTRDGEALENIILVVYVFNAGLLALATMNLWGIGILLKNARWLRKYIANT